MRSNDRLASGPAGLLWIWVGVMVMTAGAIALFLLDGNVPRVIIGIALATCLGMVIMMLWFDRRAEHETEHLGRRTAAAEEESDWHSQHMD